MPDDGLFSNLRFTDILFPAAATVASAYNPYIARGLQTGMNLFNTMSGFQGQLKYWQDIERRRKELEEAKDRARAGLGTYQEGIQAGIDALQAQTAPPAPIFLDEGQTSKFGIFKEDGPELPDPSNQETQKQQLRISDMDFDAEGPEDYDLAIQSRVNPEFSNVDMSKYGQTEEQKAELALLQNQMRFMDLMNSQMDLNPQAIANQIAQGGYAGLAYETRNAERIKDLQSQLQLQDEILKKNVLEKEVSGRIQRDVIAAQAAAQAEDRKRAAENMKLNASLYGTPGKMTQGQYDQASREAYNAIQTMVNHNANNEQKQYARDRAIDMGLKIEAAGWELPEYLKPLMEQYHAAEATKKDVAKQHQEIDKKNRTQESRVADIPPVDESRIDAIINTIKELGSPSQDLTPRNALLQPPE